MASGVAGRGGGNAGSVVAESSYFRCQQIFPTWKHGLINVAGIGLKGKSVKFIDIGLKKKHKCLEKEIFFLSPVFLITCDQASILTVSLFI